MDRTTHSPRITRLSWGRLETESAVFKDVRLYPGGAEEWDWNETGTSHDPGIQPADVERLLERGSTVVILSRGFHERLGVAPETLRMLEERGSPRTSYGPKKPPASTKSCGRLRRWERSSTRPADHSVA